MSEFIILAIPFIGTSLGSAMVFFLKKRIAPKFEKMLLGFAAGVMIAASVWSLLIPSIDMSKGSSAPEWLAALVGFLAGIFFLLLLDTVIPHMHIESRNQEGIRTNSISKTTMMLFFRFCFCIASSAFRRRTQASRGTPKFLGPALCWDWFF